MASERVTVTLPAELLEEIDRSEKNRSRFVLEAVRRELVRRRSEELRRSLREPHVEANELADTGFEDWANATGASGGGLVDERAGRRIRWSPDGGWVEVRK